jgi:hypothetical protein
MPVARAARPLSVHAEARRREEMEARRLLCRPTPKVRSIDTCGPARRGRWALCARVGTGLSAPHLSSALPREIAPLSGGWGEAVGVPRQPFGRARQQALIERGGCLYTYQAPEHSALPQAPQELCVEGRRGDMTLHVHERTRRGGSRDRRGRLPADADHVLRAAGLGRGADEIGIVSPECCVPGMHCVPGMRVRN